MKKLTPQEFHKIYLDVIKEKLIKRKLKPYNQLDEETKFIYEEVIKKINKRLKIK